ncbi:MAG: SET domain-containing protein [Chitinophagaceae bacterium]|jgi:SET domain-containing protein
MTKEELLADLGETYVMLQASTTHGVGVFAIRDIPKGTRSLFTKHHEEWIRLTHDEVNALPAYTQRLIENYCVYDKEFYYIEKSGFKKMDIVCYLNHSDDQYNLASVNSGEFFETTRDIKAGEELFLNYSELFDE